MAAGDKKASGWAQISISDWVSIVIALISLLVSLSALTISWTVWKRPPPADPTIIPTFGVSSKPMVIDAGEGGRQFFAFLDKHPGRKIRISAWIREGDGVNIQKGENEDTQGPGKVAVCTECPNLPVFGIWLLACTNAVAWRRRRREAIGQVGRIATLPGPCEDTSLAIRHNCKDCDTDILLIDGKDTAGLSGLQWKSGYVLEGYFANYGLISHRQGAAHRAIVPIDIVVAVS
jgi:hypothetical protein